MSPRTFTVWGWQRSLIYGAGFAMSFLAALQVIRSPASDLPVVAKLLGLLVPIAWLGISARLYWLRSKYAGRIAWVTSQGISVLPGEARDWLGQRRGELERHIDDVRDFWVAFLTNHRVNSGNETLWDGVAKDTAQRIDNHLNGLALEVVVTSELLEDKRHRIVAKGLTYPEHIAVQLLPEEMLAKSFPGGFWAVLRHELGHACLMAAGPVSDEEHHAFMKQAGWRDA